MHLSKRLQFVMLVAAVVSFLSLPSPASAAPQPDPAANPVLAGLMKSGAKMYYLGTQDGMDGWFIVKNGQVQIAYSLPGKKGILIGAMFDEQGNSITATQVKKLVEENKDIASLIEGAAHEQAEINSAASGAPAPKSEAGLPSVPLSPGERLMQDLQNASGVTVGDGKARLYMVMDPNCPHCQATWRALRSAVMDGELQIRMIPIGTMNTDNERAAAQFLHVANPLRVWDKYVSGDRTGLAGKPSDADLAAVRANHVLIDNWNIAATPFMIYRSKNGEVKVVQGELDAPQKVATLLADLGS